VVLCVSDLAWRRCLVFPPQCREYAARARARATGGSWPFGGEAGALPPMGVRRFRWWANEAAAVEEEEREVERRMAAKRRKRSVADLFAAVPRVAGGKGKGAVNGVQAKKGKLVLAVQVKANKKKAAPIGTAVSKKVSFSWSTSETFAQICISWIFIYVGNSTMLRGGECSPPTILR
jgi:hypothetical protein